MNYREVTNLRKVLSLQTSVMLLETEGFDPKI